MVLQKGRPAVWVHGRPIGDHVVEHNCGLSDNPGYGQFQAICTAVPVGRQWRVKAISASGDVSLLGLFEGRLAALGTAVLVAEQAGARVVP
jgi:hypothetical protein